MKGSMSRKLLSVFIFLGILLSVFLTFSFASYAITVILFIVTIFLFIQSRDYKNTIELVSKQIENRNQEIQLLLNSLPAAEVTTTYENPIVVKAKL